MKGLVYCDYIADSISKSLKTHGPMLSNVSHPKMDLTPEGYFQSTKKTLTLEDKNGTKYMVTVECLDEKS